MRQSPAARLLLVAPTVLGLVAWAPCLAQQPPAQQPPAQQLPSQQTSPAKKPSVGPTAPQSTHYPILLLVQGTVPGPEQMPTDPAISASGSAATIPTQTAGLSWSLRVGLKGPERFDRVGYPPIPLEPAEVVREGTSESWTYHAKDSQTGAAVSLHLTREPCSDPATTTRFTFTATVEHAQIGAMQGCARVATELFPKINNQPTDEDDDIKDKPVPPTVTNFKPPVAVAYISTTGKMLVKRRATAKAVPGKAGYSLCLSHDGKRLLFLRDEQPSPLRSINEYNFELGSAKELLRAYANAPFWSPDDSQIAFLKNIDGKWQVWVMPPDSPEKAAPFYSQTSYTGEIVTLHGWTDAHTVLVGDLQTFSWIGDDGTVKQTLASSDLYGKDQFSLSSGNSLRIHPLNPDLLLVSAEQLPPASASKDGARGSTTQSGQVFFLYEIHSKRRVLLSPPNLFAGDAEWSRDGLQIFFTGRDPSGGATAIYKMFWDGTSQVKVQDGRDFVIGQ